MSTREAKTPRKTVLFRAKAIDNSMGFKAGQIVEVADVINGLWALWQDDSSTLYDPTGFAKAQQ